ncbi:MAG: glycoside hydrolase family 16 protein [Puniceicoccales bacterium]
MTIPRSSFLGLLAFLAMVPFAEADSLYSPLTGDDLELLEVRGGSVSLQPGDPSALVFHYSAGGYPNVIFPCPEVGLDLSGRAGISISVTNTGNVPLRGALRIDNVGLEQDQPWNEAVRMLPPGESVEIKADFGKNNGKPGYPLDASRISEFQFFLISPKQGGQIELGLPQAYGNVDPNEPAEFMSRPTDRDTPVALPDWLGERPPIAGDWVLTLDENFDAAEIDEAIWSTRLAVIGPQREDTQRYRDQNVFLENGSAMLKVEKNPGHQYDDTELKTRDYASGMLSSYGRWTQCYGYFEMRAKLPTARGVGPLFMLIPDRGEPLNLHLRRTSHDLNGQGMEMKIMHHLTEWGAGRMSVGANWGGPAGTHIPMNWGSRYVYYGPTESGWHTYGMLWEKDRLAWYVDGIKKAEWRSQTMANVQSSLGVYLKMGHYSTQDVDEAALPDFWEIDYIRVWQRAEDITAVDEISTDTTSL